MLQHKRSGGQKPNSLRGKETNLDGGRKEEQRILVVRKPVDLGHKHYHSPYSQTTTIHLDFVTLC
jgi:hypothetical protein